MEAQIKLIQRICLNDSILIDVSPPNNQSNFAVEQIEEDDDDDDDEDDDNEDNGYEVNELGLISLPGLDAGFRS